MKENKMGTMPVNKLLINMSLPMVVSMLVQALYNIVDSIFVARINEEALTAVSLAFPLQVLIIAVGAGMGVGVNAVLSKALGEKNGNDVNKAANNGLFITLFSYLIFLLIGLFGTEAFIKSQTSELKIVEYGIDYLSIILICSLGLFYQLIFERLLMATGKTFYSMIVQLTGAVINIILDPILIFGLLGAPKMGVAGAAVATVAGQTVAAILGLIINRKVNHEIKLNPLKYGMDSRMMGKIFAIGIPSVIMQAIGSVMTFGMNKILIQFNTTATAVFGVYFKLQSFIFMPIFGISNGIVPIVAYNFGAKNKERLMKTMKLGIIYSLSIMFLGVVIFQTIPERLLSMFNASEDMLRIGVPALRIISLGFLLAGYNIIVVSVFQALGNGLYSMLVSVVRQLVVILPVAFFLAKVGGLSSVWWSLPIAEAVSIVMCFFFFRRTYRNLIVKLEQ